MEHVKDAGSDRLFNIINYFVLTLCLIIVLYPLVYVLSASFSSPLAVTSGKVWLFPVDFSFEGYQAVFKHRMIGSGFINALVYTALGTLISVVLSILAAYPLSRSDFQGRNLFMLLFAFTMLFSGGLIPSYLIVKDLGMLDSIWSMVIPSALSVWNVIIMMTYFRTTIPKEIQESAHMDGCGDIMFLLKIILPLSGPIIAVIALFYAVDQWNQYFNAMIFLRRESLFPLQLILRDILLQNEIDLTALSNLKTAAARQGMKELLKYALIVIATLPLLVVYPFVQKYFVKGVMIGSIKG